MTPPRTAFQRYRILVLPISAMVIAFLVGWRMHWESQRRELVSGTPAHPKMMAPNFVLADNHRHVVKLSGYLGRTRLLIRFFDGTQPAHMDPVVRRMRDDFEKLKSAGVQPLAISSASPFAVAKSEEFSGKPFPFPILMDVDTNGLIPTPAHRVWGLAEGDSVTLKTGTFLVDRMGRVSVWQGHPYPVSDADKAIDGLVKGEWPEEPLPKVHTPQTVDPASLPGY